MNKFYDMVIIGAGLSGVGAACRYVNEFPEGNLAVLEARGAIGGTWDLFKYPGIRSDSDMLTLGYDFRPWPGVKTLAAGPDIRDYVRDTAREYGIDKRIQFNSRVTGMDFSTADDLWTISIEDAQTGDVRTILARFVLSCAGYYSYAEGHDPEFAGREDFAGDIIHPQFWPDNYEYTGKKIAVIGSGATAVTLVPELSKTAAYVTQVQRTPSYVASIPSVDPVMKWTSKFLPKSLNFKFNRWKNVKLAGYFYRRAQSDPARARRKLRKMTQKALGTSYPVDVHFNPPYNPWDQRLCMIPDGDMFDAINQGRAEIVTGQIDRFVKDGIQMQDGSHVKADLIVTATGLKINLASNSNLSIDGAPQKLAQSFGYKGLMFSNIPNLVSVFGYTNASWTLRADLMSRYAVRMLRHLTDNKLTRVTPIAPDGMEKRPWIDFQAGYLLRVLDDLPKQGDRMPWLNIQNYAHDQEILLNEPIEGEGLEFRRADHTAAPDLKPTIAEAAE